MVRDGLETAFVRAKLPKRAGLYRPAGGASMKASRHKMSMEEMYHFKAFAVDHWLEILVVGMALIFVLMKVTGQK
jgi:hypothetical protein